MSFQSVVSNKPRSAIDNAAISAISAIEQENPRISDFQRKSDDTEYALKVFDLCKSFKSGFLRKKIRGISGVNFAVKHGEVFAILGHNGAGKTTTINCILDLVHPDHGEINILGLDAGISASRLKIGYLPERPYFFEHLTGLELLQFYGKLLDMPKKEMDSRIDEVLDRLGMSEFQNRKLRKYSKGMLQRIGLAQAILGKPELLILDEPMSGLDPVGRKEVRELLLELKATGCTIILSSHIVPDVELLADSVLILKEGQVVMQKELHKFNEDATYSINILNEEISDINWPKWAQKQVTESNSSNVPITANSVVRLQEILAICHSNNTTIQSVDTHRTALEDLFMKANIDQEVNS